MAESFPIEALPRPTLLAPAARHARLAEATPLVLAAVAGEEDPIVVQTTLACLLFHTFAQTNWCGFYRRVGPELLAVGPYQGTLGCLRIPFSRGVCGAAARERRTQLVPDVHAFADHIACDSASRSELVVPVLDADGVRAVLDLDSPLPDGFSEHEARALEALVAQAFAHARW